MLLENYNVSSRERLGALIDRNPLMGCKVYRGRAGYGDMGLTLTSYGERGMENFPEALGSHEAVLTMSWELSFAGSGGAIQKP